MTALFFDLGKFTKALECLEHSSNRSVDPIKKEIQLKMLGYNATARDQYLKMFFGEQIANYIKSAWRTNDVFQGILNKLKQSVEKWKQGEPLKQIVTKKMYEAEIDQIKVSQIVR